MSEPVVWKCGSCAKLFETYHQLKRHLEEWHSYIQCKICNKTIKKGSIYRHLKIYHKPAEPCIKKQDLFTDEEIQQLNTILDQQLQRSVDELINNIDQEKSQLFHNVNMDDYLKIFDEATTKPSKYPTDEEFKEIQTYWLLVEHVRRRIQD